MATCSRTMTIQEHDRGNAADAKSAQDKAQQMVDEMKATQAAMKDLTENSSEYKASEDKIIGPADRPRKRSASPAAGIPPQGS